MPRAVATPPQSARTITPEPDPDVYEIGARLKHLREQHGLSIRELARRSGVSASLISEAERGKVEPSVGVLKRLANVLEVTMTYFFSRPGASGETVVRADERPRLPALQGVSYELAGPEHVRTLEPIFARLEPGANMEDQTFMTHEGEEWGMVLRGRLKVWIGTEVYFLGVGDSVYFASSVPHRVANPTDEVTEYIWVNSPATF